jgi:hypothetical protein
MHDVGKPLITLIKGSIKWGTFSVNTISTLMHLKRYLTCQRQILKELPAAADSLKAAEAAIE